MTQHINLLSRRRSGKSLSWLITRGLTGLIIVFVVWGGLAEVNLQRLAATEQETQNAVTALWTELQISRRNAGLEDAQVLNAESAQMRRTMNERPELVQVVQRGEVGSLQGHAGVLQTLASIPQPGVWLQAVEVSKAGQAIKISGSALTSAAVIQYAEQLNQSFKPAGIEFSALEISKEDAPKAGGGAKASPIKFKLY
jgi:hypothetical protein